MKDFAGFLLCAFLLTAVGCARIGANYPSLAAGSGSAAADSTRIIVVDGKQYRCINEDGTWKCAELEALQTVLTGHGQPDASRRKPLLNDRPEPPQDPHNPNGGR